jgi:hypothetical protein
MTESTPAQRVFAVFGGAPKLAALLELDQSTVYRWNRTGLVPAKYQGPILDLADLCGYALTAEDVIQR